jgi:hypothetical protein
MNTTARLCCGKNQTMDVYDYYRSLQAGRRVALTPAQGTSAADSKEKIG